ncbi:hypothetical protein JOL62DRAFT_560776 [Phyllosticta paracitricarpa]|uniref:Uncharacterized protein n=1 Tax=Phyllosticta paracitricarpa TaxID=2016321 RepID=A0ABR1MS09_9PEZI
MMLLLVALLPLLILAPIATAYDCKDVRVQCLYAVITSDDYDDACNDFHELMDNWEFDHPTDACGGRLSISYNQEKEVTCPCTGVRLCACSGSRVAYDVRKQVTGQDCGNDAYASRNCPNYSDMKSGAVVDDDVEC